MPDEQILSDDLEGFKADILKKQNSGEVEDIIKRNELNWLFLNGATFNQKEFKQFLKDHLPGWRIGSPGLEKDTVRIVFEQ